MEIELEKVDGCLLPHAFLHLALHLTRLAHLVTLHRILHFPHGHRV